MGLFSSIGGILGGIGGAIFGGPVGAVIGSGLGGSVGGAVDANGANKQAQGYYNQQMDFAKQQAQFQQDYAKQVMQWRVEDAKKAGVHPMAALGVSNPSYSPVSAPSAPQVYDAGQFDTGSTFGQSLNRASMQAKTMEQQQKAAQLGFQQIGLQNKGLELDNQYKALQVAQLASELQRNGASSAPAPVANGGKTLIGGQGDSPIQDSSILGKDVHRLFNLAMHGDSAVLVVNPDIADAISESVVNNTIASIVREVETGNNPALIDEIISKFPKRIQRAIRDGEMRLASIPGSGAFRVVPVGPNESFSRYNVFGID